MIEAIKLNKVYNDGAKELRVLRDINLKIGQGEFIAIVGPSGAGKSTLLHILGGLDEPTEGEVMFDDSDLYKMPEAQRAQIRNRHVGFVFQFYHLLPEFTALENVLMPSLISGKPARAKAKELLTRFGLADRITHRPNQLSGGEQQRAAIARALINSPKLLLCDEPTGNLDSKTGGEVMDVLLKLNREESVTCVMVTHQESLASGSSRALHMMDGGMIDGF